MSQTQSLELHALSLWPPWVTFIKEGWKLHETRSWRPAHSFYSGEDHFWCALHQTKTMNTGVKDLCKRGRFEDLLALSGLDTEDVPLGAFLCVVRFGYPIRTENVYDRQTIKDSEWMDQKRIDFDLGDFDPGRWAWPIEEVINLPEPVEWKGAQSLFRWKVPEQLIPFLNREMIKIDQELANDLFS